jgi:hypothetical protein
MALSGLWSRVFLGATTALLALSITWAAATEPPEVSAVLTGAQSRSAYLAHATIWRDPEPLSPDEILAGPSGILAEAASDAEIGCTFSKPGRELGGNTPKFLCTTDDRRKLRVKYWDRELQTGNREVFATVAASRLMWALGFESLRTLLLNLRCDGCPQNPMTGEGARRTRLYLAALQESSNRPLIVSRNDRDQGWSWREFDEAIKGLPPGPERIRQRTHFDALTLLGVFMQHGDRKPEQQALYCDAPIDLAAGETHPRDKSDRASTLLEAPGASACARAVAMIVDLGVTFGGAGRTSRGGSATMNLAQWRSKTVFKDSNKGLCHGRLTVSLKAGEDGEGDPVISEDGRRFLVEQLQRLSASHVRAIFAAARLDQAPGLFKPAADGGNSTTIDDWVAAFQDKVQQIATQRCQPAS